MPIKKVKDIIDKSAEKNVWVVSFSGGEPTLYPDIVEAISYAKRKKIVYIQMVSNGIETANYRFCEKLVKAGLNEVKFSLHSLNRKVHNNLVGSKIAFDSILKSSDNFNKLGIKISFNFAINRLNYKEIPIFVKTMHDYGITGFCFMFSFYEGNMLNNTSISVSYTEVKSYLKTAIDYMKKKKILIETRMLNNFPPCVIPEYINLISDWGGDKIDNYSKVFNRNQNLNNPSSERKEKIENCKKCLYYRKCRGIDRGYVKFYGIKEFRPVRQGESVSFDVYYG
ncbi:MAG: hypothetical protein Fur0012_04740 [Elusimicrobiota bacterium]